MIIWKRISKIEKLAMVKRKIIIMLLSSKYTHNHDHACKGLSMKHCDHAYEK